MTATTSGVSIRQMMSFTSSAERTPEVKIRCTSSACGVLARRRIQSAAQSKNPARHR